MGSAWTLRDEIAAISVELEHAALRTLRSMAGDKTARHVKPLKIPRPNQTKRKPTRDPHEIRRFLNATSSRRG